MSLFCSLLDPKQRGDLCACTSDTFLAKLSALPPPLGMPLLTSASRLLLFPLNGGQNGCRANQKTNGSAWDIFSKAKIMFSLKENFIGMQHESIENYKSQRKTGGLMKSCKESNAIKANEVFNQVNIAAKPPLRKEESHRRKWAQSDKRK